jgi:23S rRNA (guanosine2251-2'-O)-methyltransferase
MVRLLVVVRITTTIMMMSMFLAPPPPRVVAAFGWWQHQLATTTRRRRWPKSRSLSLLLVGSPQERCSSTSLSSFGGWRRRRVYRPSSAFQDHLLRLAIPARRRTTTAHHRCFFVGSSASIAGGGERGSDTAAATSNYDDDDAEGEEEEEVPSSTPTPADGSTMILQQQQQVALRKTLLRECLLELGMDADGLAAAVRLATTNTTTHGYDGRYGKSVIKTCRTFWRNGGNETHLMLDDNDNASSMEQRLRTAARRTAHQIQFLYKRHEAHRAEWIRHTDDMAKMMQSATTSSHHNTTTTTASNTTTTRKLYPLVLILDNLRSANNVGSLFRTADAAGCTMLITVGITARPFGPGAEKLQKAAKGAQYTVPHLHFPSLPTAISYLRTARPGYQVLGVETTTQSVDYTAFPYWTPPNNNQDGDDEATNNDNGGVALILGNEVTGVDPTILPTLDGIVEIPMFGAKNSLNVAVCAPIILYEIHRQWRRQQ